MEIMKAGSQASGKGLSEWFTGSVRIDPLFQTPDPAMVQGASVTFEPGRADWHTHPLGQTLIVTAGVGGFNAGVNGSKRSGLGCRVVLAKREALARSLSRTAMTHIAIQEKKDGKVVDWM